MPKHLVDSLPHVLLELGPRGISWWQWVALLLIALGSWILGIVAGRFTRAALITLARRTSFALDDAIVPQLRGPMTIAWAAVIGGVLVHFIGLRPSTLSVLYRIVVTVLFVAFFWLLWRIVAVLRDVMERSTWAQRNPASRSLLPLGGRVVQVLVLAIGVVAVLAQLGYPVASLVAGLGIGGLALALAAQKTVENLFGAFSLSIDQTFRVGDAIKVDAVEGAVEVIGLRSTRLRTADRTLVTIPNGKLAEMRIESLTARDRLRFAGVYHLVLGTTAVQLRAVLAGWEAALRAQPKLWPGTVTVKLKEIGPFALDVEVAAWFDTTNGEELLVIRQDVLLAFLDVVERAGTAFAFPTQTVHIEKTAAG